MSWSQYITINWPTQNVGYTFCSPWSRDNIRSNKAVISLENQSQSLEDEKREAESILRSSVMISGAKSSAGIDLCVSWNFRPAQMFAKKGCHFWQASRRCWSWHLETLLEAPTPAVMTVVCLTIEQNSCVILLLLEMLESLNKGFKTPLYFTHLFKMVEKLLTWWTIPQILKLKIDLTCQSPDCEPEVSSHNPAHWVHPGWHRSCGGWSRAGERHTVPPERKAGRCLPMGAASEVGESSLMEKFRGR